MFPLINSFFPCSFTLQNNYLSCPSNWRNFQWTTKELWKIVTWSRCWLSPTFYTVEHKNFAGVIFGGLIGVFFVCRERLFYSLALRTKIYWGNLSLWGVFSVQATEPRTGRKLCLQITPLVELHSVNRRHRWFIDRNFEWVRIQTSKKLLACRFFFLSLTVINLCSISFGRIFIFLWGKFFCRSRTIQN